VYIIEFGKESQPRLLAVCFNRYLLYTFIYHATS
jgi:hypothetical protein